MTNVLGSVFNLNFTCENLGEMLLCLVLYLSLNCITFDVDEIGVEQATVAPSLEMHE